MLAETLTPVSLPKLMPALALELFGLLVWVAVLAAHLMRLTRVVPDAPDWPQLREVSATAIRQPLEGLKMRRWDWEFMASKGESVSSGQIGPPVFVPFSQKFERIFFAKFVAFLAKPTRIALIQ
jgi:hypothetical protein